MALGQAEFPSTLGVDLEVAFQKGIQANANVDWRQLIEVVPTTSNSKKEVFYGDDGRLRRWKAERQGQKFNEYLLNLNADRWEYTREWKRNEVNHDQSGGLLIRRVTDFGNAVSISLEREFWEFLHNGTSIKGFDRANLFDFNHAYVTSSGVTISNVGVSGLQSNMHLGGSQLDATTLQLEQQAFSDIATDTNNKWGLQMSHVAVYRGSLNAKNARELNNSQFTVEASTVKGTMTENVFRGSFSIIETAYGIGASEWYSFALGNPEMKPVKVLSETVNPGFDNPRFTTLGLDSESSESFYRGIVAAGVEMNFDFNPGYWQTVRLHGSSSYVFTPTDLENQRTLYPNV